MIVQNIKVAELKPYEKNPRMNDNAVSAVAESIKAYGFRVPIVIDKNHVIVCGHTRYKAAQMLGLEEVPCTIADDLTPEQVKAFRIADNKVSDFSIWDNKLLLDELDGLEDLFTGFEITDITKLAYEWDESQNDTVANNEYGVVYEIVLRSKSEDKIKRIKMMVEDMEDFDEDET